MGSLAPSWTPPKGYESRPIAVLGGGVLGRRIAACWTAAGYTVNIRDPDASQRAGALKYIAENLPAYQAQARKADAGTPQVFEELAPAVAGAWLVFECVPEKLGLKISTFAELETAAPADAILATNSSSYKSSEMIGKVSSDAARARILNTHYLMPPGIMATELMTDGFTAPEIFPFLVERFKEAGLKPYVAKKESTGFIFNRLWAAIKREELMILAEGVADVETMDGIYKDGVLKSGKSPFFLMDAVGLDTVAFIEEHYIAERGLPSYHLEHLKKNYIDQGRLGMKSPQGGFYPPEFYAAAGIVGAVTPAAPAHKERRIITLDVGLSGAEVNWKNGNVVEVTTDGSAIHTPGGRPATLRTLFDKQAIPDGVAVAPAHDRVFWTCMGIPGRPDGAVYSASLSSPADAVAIVPPTGVVNTPKQIAVDEDAQQLYFCDREGLGVYRCGFDGSGLACVVRAGDARNSDAERADATKWCVGVAVAPRSGKLFWTQKGAAKSNCGRVFVAGLDVPAGATAETRDDAKCLLDGLPEPIDLEWHEESRTLYWTDRGELPYGNTLNCATLDAEWNVVPPADGGKLKHRVLARKFHEAIGLKLDAANGHVYVTDLGGSIYRCNLDGSDKTVLYRDDGRAFTGLALL